VVIEAAAMNHRAKQMGFDATQTFGGINLEDISAPRCFEIEQRLIEECDIPVFHDDQHGTAIVVLAALFNSLKLVIKDIEDIKVVVNGGGSAGLSITRKLLSAGAKHVTVVDRSFLVIDKPAEPPPL
ncbi:malic enzyme-like NAD(P)-binding protein, partial [Streptococcus agalactiae]|uniref:malic enzyme-like NAD(P)-binding protein n=1 Tax=Streptococcus agalactiae TaxID=1311 RepID=UPI003626A282